MVTDNERRDVARRLRKLDYEDLQESLICAYLDVLGIEGYMDWVGIAHRLADLIEPPARCPHYMHPCCRTDAGGDYIDRDALLKLADEMDAYTKCDDERCGREMPPRVIHDFARRIRKILGEES